MKLQQSFSQQQTIKLTMTEELSQAIELLQLSAQQLTLFLEEKALENPLIEITKSPEYDLSRPKSSQSAGGDFSEEHLNLIEQFGDNNSDTIQQFLLSQLNIKQLTNEQEEIFNKLIIRLDENGYLREKPAELANRLQYCSTEIEEVLAILQSMEPAGIGAYDLRQCLLLQIDNKNETTKLAREIVEHYFVEFAEKNWHPITRKLKITLADIQVVFDYVATLNPRPGALFNSEQPLYIVPDVIVKLSGRSFQIQLVDEHLPRVTFNEQYNRKFSNYTNKELSNYLQQKHHEYNWIMKGLQQRRETLYRVVAQIVKQQEDFFRASSGQLVPMTMKELADELGVHESTISRAVREKYVQTPFGTYPLRSFFTSAIKSTTKGSQSATEVKSSIKKVVAAEDKYKPLSDQKIADCLKKNYGIVISRRTVAKYRSELKIPSSSKRKRY